MAARRRPSEAIVHATDALALFEAKGDLPGQQSARAAVQKM